MTAFFLAHFAGRYDLPDGAVLSVPVTFTDGKWSALADVSVGDELRERLELSASEIRRVRQAAKMTLFKRVFIAQKTCCRRFNTLPFQKYFKKKKKKVLKVVFFFPRKKNLEQKLKKNE